jgi:hypothetical protein
MDGPTTRQVVALNGSWEGADPWIITECGYLSRLRISPHTGPVAGIGSASSISYDLWEAIPSTLREPHGIAFIPG